MKKLQAETLKQLYSMDSKLKFDNNWNQQVKSLFDKYSVFNFDELIKIDMGSVSQLMEKFK